MHVAAPQASPAGATYCCGIGNAADCGSPDWSQIKFTFDAAATTTNVFAVIDSADSTCKDEVGALKTQFARSIVSAQYHLIGRHVSARVS